MLVCAGTSSSRLVYGRFGNSGMLSYSTEGNGTAGTSFVRRNSYSRYISAHHLQIRDSEEHSVSTMDSRAGAPAIGRLPADARNQLHPTRPPSNTGVRLSVYDCCGGDGDTAGGRIVRDHGGQMVVAFYIFRTADMTTNADIDGLLYGLLLCQSHNKDINSIDISSQRIANILNSRARTP
ncbi:hypothetical protein M6B38_308315 [Iris pallida]|uniref:RNase H type-1 domain-containing protein n=1 Tax=Iris pallida TaxID=29817 RepID=A0AAX6HKP3_IRIPA|nr:hypothetical protein M6B38_308315 [Iris pallida]